METKLAGHAEHPRSRLVERTQDDELQEEYSIMSGIDFTGVEEITRQEFKDDADLNILLARFGVNTPVRQMKYGEDIDYTMDLQQALSAVEAARRTEHTIPNELRHKYTNWRDILNAAETGEYQHDLANLAERKHKLAEKEAEAAEADKKTEKTKSDEAEK
jgi:hypothetical protein